MISEQRDLFQAIITDHDTRPRHFCVLDAPTHVAEGFNPVCGDRYHIYLILDGDRITEIGFDGYGCAISKASASIMTTMVEGKTVAEAEGMFNTFQDMLHSRTESGGQELGELVAFEGVKKFPVRIKCAVLAWHTLRAALKGQSLTTTE